MSIPKEPRQQMINLMYLVLTALLALNIQAEILDAFYLVKDGIATSIGAMDSRNNSTLEEIAHQYRNNPAKVEAVYENSIIVAQIADKLYQEIEGLEQTLTEACGGLEEDGKFKRPNDLNNPSMILLNQGKGKALQASITDARAVFLDMINQAEDGHLASKISLKAENPTPTELGEPALTWAEKNFENVPLVAISTLLSAMKNDIRNSEAIVLNHLFEQIGQEYFDVDRMVAQVNSKRDFVNLGEDFEASIFPAAWSSTQHPVVMIGEFNSSIVVRDELGRILSETNEFPLIGKVDTLDVAAGSGSIQIRAARSGLNRFSGAIEIKDDATGKKTWYPFEHEFMAAEETLIVSPDKMNVVYAGIDNPVSISVPGYAAEQIRPTISNGKLIAIDKKTGKYAASDIKFLPGRVIEIGAVVEMEEGRKNVVKKSKFRVKRVPDPLAAINGRNVGGEISAGQLKSAIRLNTWLKDFHFEGVKFEILSYELAYIPKRNDDPKIEQNQGAKFEDEVNDLINKARKGDMYLFRKIRAQGPEGDTRKLNRILLEVI